MKIKLKEPVKIGNKQFVTNSTIDVINEIGMNLIVHDRAYCVDGTFGNNIKYTPAVQVGKKSKHKAEK